MSAELTWYSHALALLAYVALALLATARWKLLSGRVTQRWLFLGAAVSSAAWAALHMAIAGGAVGPSVWLQPLDIARYACWLALLMGLTQTADGHTARPVRTLRAVVWILLASLLGLSLFGGALPLPVSEIYALYSLLALATSVCGLLAVEQVLRGAAEGVRWNAKPLCLGLGCVFGFDVYLYSMALLLGRFDLDALTARGAAHALAVPFILVSLGRGPNLLGRLQLSHTAAFYSASLLLAGVYLLLVAAAGYYVRFFGGPWGGPLQVALIAAGAAALGMLLLSQSIRSRVRVFVGKHFQRYRFDYRHEWLRFTAMLSGRHDPRELCELVVQGLARMVECPGGSLWTRDTQQAPLRQVACWNSTRIDQLEGADSALCTFLAVNGWVIDLDEYRDAPHRYPELALPNWLLGLKNSWLIVPLLAGDELLGFVVLSKPLAPQKLNWEVLDLLKTAGRQAAGHLAQMQATEALLEARKFESFNKMSAFVVHDLKNIVAQLSLMLKNAERLHDNREFQQDMLLTVESSLEKMKRLMLQLREGATPPGGSRGVELGPILQRLQKSVRQQGRDLQVDATEPLATRGHDERLERVLGHLVQNALDATPASGRVWVRVARRSGQIEVEVGDTGAGMSEDFVRNRLFRPFNTTKHNGMGIGTYESYQYIRELGGQIDVDSRVGEGTRVSVLLPLFEAGRGSDLMPAAGAR